MKKLFAVMTTLALLLPAAGYAEDWIKFVPSGGRCSILLPVQPTEAKETTDSSHGPYTTVFYISRNDGEAYLFGWVDYDPKFKFDIQSELDANRDNFLKGAKATLLKTTKIAHGAHPGIEFTAENATTFFQSRVFVVGKRPYQLVAAVPKGQDRSRNIKKFLSSFKLSGAGK